MGLLKFFKQRHGYTAVDSDANDAEASTGNIPLTEKHEKVAPSQEEESTSRLGASSTWRATVNAINYMEGAGFLALPYAVSRGGLAAVLAFLFVPVIMAYTSRILVECLYEDCKDGTRSRVRSSYQEIARSVWPMAERIIMAYLFINWFNLSTSYIVMCSSLMSGFSIPGFTIGQDGWAALTAIVVLPLVFCKSLKSIAWLSCFGNVALVAACATVFIYEFESFHTWDLKSLLFWDAWGFLVASNIIVFSYSIQAIAINIEESMADRSQYGRVVGLTFLCTTIVKAPFALLGYLTYKANTQQIIILNIPGRIPRIFVIITYTISTILTYPLPAHLLVGVLENGKCGEAINSKLPSPKIWLVLSRILIVFLTLSAAICIPHFALLTSLSGSVISYSVCLFFPAVLHLSLNLDIGMPRWKIMADWFCIIITIVGSALGCFAAVQAIVMATL